jgi:uncharacterized C2H2 Zn-finger protein
MDYTTEYTAEFLLKCYEFSDDTTYDMFTLVDNIYNFTDNLLNNNYFNYNINTDNYNINTDNYNIITDNYNINTDNYNIKTNNNIKTTVMTIIKDHNSGLYICPFNCGRSFKRNYSAKSHVICHTNERNFKCNTCGYAFGRKHDLKRHILKIHKNEKS